MMKSWSLLLQLSLLVASLSPLVALSAEAQTAASPPPRQCRQLMAASRTWKQWLVGPSYNELHERNRIEQLLRPLPIKRQWWQRGEPSIRGTIEFKLAENALYSYVLGFPLWPSPTNLSRRIRLDNPRKYNTAVWIDTWTGRLHRVLLVAFFAVRFSDMEIQNLNVKELLVYDFPVAYNLMYGTAWLVAAANMSPDEADETLRQWDAQRIMDIHEVNMTTTGDFYKQWAAQFEQDYGHAPDMNDDVDRMAWKDEIRRLSAPPPPPP